MKIYCRACRAAVPEQAQYCPSCGAYLGEASPVAPTPAADQPADQPHSAAANQPQRTPEATHAAKPHPRGRRRRQPAKSVAARATAGKPAKQGKARTLAGLAILAVSIVFVWQWLSSESGGDRPRATPSVDGSARPLNPDAPSVPFDVEGIDGIVDIDAPAVSSLPSNATTARGNADTREASLLAAANPARDEAAVVLKRVLTAQTRGDLAALEQEWRLDAFGAAVERMQRTRLRAVAASVQFDQFAFRERATMFSEDGSHAMVRAEVSFRATHASGVSHWANGVLGVLRRARSEAGWEVIAAIPDQLLNNEIAERADRQASWHGPASNPLRPQRLGAASTRSCARAATALAPVSMMSVAAQDRSSRNARPMTYAELNRELDAAMNREFGVTKLKFVANGLNTQIGQIPGAGDLVSFVYQIGDTGMNSMEVLGETMKHGFTHVGALKATQVFVGVVQLVSELYPPTDIASDILQYRLETITANAEIRRTIDHIKRDLESGRLKFSAARLRQASGRRYPAAVRLSIEDAGSALLDPANSDMVQVSFEGAVVAVAVTTPELLNHVSPRLPFEVVAQVVINAGQVRYEAFDERAAKVLGAVQRGSRWVIPVLLGRQTTSDASSGSPVLADFQRMRLQLDDRIHPDSAANWAWQPCRGTQRLAARLQDGSTTLPVTVRNNFLNQLRDLVVVDGQDRLLQRITLGPGESLTDLKLLGIDVSGKKTNLTAMLRRQLACVDLQVPDSNVVAARAGSKSFSIAAAGAGRTKLGLRIAGDAETPDLNLALPIVVTQGDAGWRLAEVKRNDYEVPLMLNHRRETGFSDTGLSVTCGVTQTIPDAELPMSEWPKVGYDAEVRVQWGAMPDNLVVGQTVRVNASVSRRYEPTSGWQGDAPPAHVSIEVPDAESVRGEAGSSASASFVVPPPRPGRTLGIGISAGGCGVQSARTFIYRPVGE